MIFVVTIAAARLYVIGYVYRRHLCPQALEALLAFDRIAREVLADPTSSTVVPEMKDVLKAVGDGKKAEALLNQMLTTMQRANGNA